jgi:hypothetical protein
MFEAAGVEFDSLPTMFGKTLTPEEQESLLTAIQQNQAAFGQVNILYEMHADGVKSVFVNREGRICDAGGLNIIESTDECPFCTVPCDEPHCPYTKDEK